MTSRTYPFLTGGLALAAGLALASSASASVSQVCFSVRASAVIEGVTHTALYEVSSEQMYYDEATQTYGWDLQSPFELRSSGGVLLGMINEGSVRAIEDPVVSVNFAVSAGAVQTAFDITSAQLGFATINSATGMASASFTANDNNFDGIVTVAPLGVFPGNALYVARYNNPGVLDGTDLGGTGLLLGGPYSSPFITGDAGTIPLQVVPGAIGNMQAGFSFSLTPGDQAGGTSTFTIVPAPGAAGLLGLAGLLVSRRRR